VLASGIAGRVRPPELVDIDNPEFHAESVPEVSRHRVFIMTPREASEVVGAFYSSGHAPELGLASMDVTVPPGHIPGQLLRFTQFVEDSAFPGVPVLFTWASAAKAPRQVSAPGHTAFG
jgi:esterase/lipase superfamily enzyme